MNAEIGLIHRYIRPRDCEQFLVADDLPCPLCQRNQGIERASAERYRIISLLEKPLGQRQAEWAKGKHALGLEITTTIDVLLRRHPGHPCEAELLDGKAEVSSRGTGGERRSPPISGEHPGRKPEVGSDPKSHSQKSQAPY